MPEKMTQSTRRNVTWQTNSEYCRLAVPSGRSLNYISFAQKIQIPKIFGSSLYIHAWCQHTDGYISLSLYLCTPCRSHCLWRQQTNNDIFYI